MTTPVRLAFVGQRVYFHYCALEEPADGVEPAFFDFRPEGSPDALLAALDAYGHDGQPPSVPLPKWRRRLPPTRPTTCRLLSQLRVELWSQSIRRDSLQHFWSRQPSSVKSHQLGSALAAAVFHSHN